MRRALSISLALALCLLSAAAWAAPPADGEKLVRELWANSAAHQWAQKAGRISPAFQSVQASGARDKAQELANLDKVEFGSFELSGFRTTQEGPVAVVTYLARVEEVVDGMRVGGRTAPRLSVFIYTNKGWQWLAHANLKAAP